MGEDNKVREAINQGFVRTEIATARDDKATQIYKAKEIDPHLLKGTADQAVDNYMAAISCFLRTLPSIKDQRSNNLIRTEVDRLLKRLEEMRILSKRADNVLEGKPIDHGIDDLEPINLNDLVDEFDVEEDPPMVHEPEFAIGSLVDVSALYDDDYVRSAVITDYDVYKDTYSVQYDDDHSFEAQVDADRVMLREDDDEEEEDDTDDSDEDADVDHEAQLATVERERIFNELVEAERAYVRDLTDLEHFYYHPLINPSHWGGQKESSETLFSTKTLNDAEAKTLFGNLIEIIALHKNFLADLEKTTEAGSAKVFLEYGPHFRQYAAYALNYENGAEFLKTVEDKRQGFISVQSKAKECGIQPMDSLMRRPLGRIAEYHSSLRQLQARTPESSPTVEDMESAVDIMDSISEKINILLTRNHNQQEIAEIEKKFRPSIALVAPHRMFRKHGMLQIMERRKMVKRHFWLFNDIMLCARSSDWFARGCYRHLDTIRMHKVEDAPQYGPLAIKISESSPKTWIIVFADDHERVEWMRPLEAFQMNRRSKRGSSATSAAGTNAGAASGAPPPPPPPRTDLNEPALPEGWVELVDPKTARVFYYNELENKTSWTLPKSDPPSDGDGVVTWVAGQAQHTFNASNPGELSFKAGEKLLFRPETEELGWVEGKNAQGQVGNVPMNWIKKL